jgi:Plasmid pRiA4b ORF-3-like protein
MSAADSIVHLKIVLDHTEPPIWRAVELPATTGLKELHRIIQSAMGWDDEHLYSFQVGRQKIGGRVQLGELAASGIKRFGYLYDMGDSWQHTLRIEKTLAADPKQSYPLWGAKTPSGASH